jgi:hypothetical protein
MKEVLFFDAERGDMVLSDRPWLHVIHSKKFAQLARTHEFLRLHCRLRDEYVKSPDPAVRDAAREKLLSLEEKIRGERPDEPTLYYTFVVDTLTEVNQYLMYQLLQMDPDRWALDAVPTGAEWAEWKQGSDMTLILLRQLRDLPMHVIVLAHTMENEVSKPGIGKVTEKRVSLPGKLPGRVPGFWDIFGYLQKQKDTEGKDRFRLWLNDGPNGAWKAKHRMKFVKVDYVDSPTLPKLLDLAKQEWAAADEAAAPSTRTQPNRPNTNGVTNARTAGTAGPTQPRPATRPAAGTPAGPRAGAAGAGRGPSRGPVRPGR